MGTVKDIYIEYGYYPLLDKFVCPDCFNDSAIKEFIRTNSQNNKCDYCHLQKKEKQFSTSIDEVIKFIRKGILFEWGDPAEQGVPYESAEGGWQLFTIYHSTTQLIEEEIEELSDLEKDLLDDILYGLTDDKEWCQKDPYNLSENEELIFDWREFCNLVKYKTRYVFYKLTTRGKPVFEWEEQEREPYQILEELGNIVTNWELIKKEPAGKVYYRVRTHTKEENLNSPSELGPPPRDKANYSNRMSPAGIPMFYTALDRETAVSETPPKEEHSMATIGNFISLKDFKILDLTRLPPVPSLFDLAERHTRGKLSFLHSFNRDLSKPVNKDGREHIDYVPTQIVTEYFRHIFKDPAGDSLKGIYYKSSKNPSGTSCVLFFENDAIEGVVEKDNLFKGEKWFKLNKVEKFIESDTK